MRLLLALVLSALLVMAADAQILLLGVGGGSFTSVPLTPCSSTGIFNLSNVCNDIYFIGALK